jgi:hypothetical protein
MSNYPIYTVETAPEQSKAALQDLQQTFGMIPNVAGAMAESPTLLGAFVPVFRQVHSGTFTEAEYCCSAMRAPIAARGRLRSTLRSPCARE